MQFEIYSDVAGEYRWRLKADNGEIIADSAEGYNRRGHAVKMVAKIMTEVEYATVKGD